MNTLVIAKGLINTPDVDIGSTYHEDIVDKLDLTFESIFIRLYPWNLI